MVKLENPYAFNRPRPSHYFTVVALFIFGYLIKKFSTFLFAYQFSLPVLLVLLMGYIMDRSILSKRMLVGGEFPDLGRIYYFLSPLLLSAGFIAITRLLHIPPHYFLHFSAQATVPRWELAVLLMLIAVPASEVVFRGYFQYLYAHLFGKKAALVASTITYVMFFLLLTKNIYVLGYAAVMGTLFSYISLRESSILPTIIAHEICIIALLVCKF